MKKTYYKICSNLDRELELIATLDRDDHFYIYSYGSEGTKFPTTRLDDVRAIANVYNGLVFEVHEEWTPVIKKQTR